MTNRLVSYDIDIGYYDGVTRAKLTFEDGSEVNFDDVDNNIDFLAQLAVENIHKDIEKEDIIDQIMVELL